MCKEINCNEPFAAMMMSMNMYVQYVCVEASKDPLKSKPSVCCVHHMLAHSICMLFCIAKNDWQRIAVQCGKCWVSATGQFQRTILTFVARWVCDSVFKMNRCSRREMLTNRHTDRQSSSNPRCACASRVNNIPMHNILLNMCMKEQPHSVQYLTSGLQIKLFHTCAYVHPKHITLSCTTPPIV